MKKIRFACNLEGKLKEKKLPNEGGFILIYLSSNCKTFHFLNSFKWKIIEKKTFFNIISQYFYEINYYSF